MVDYKALKTVVQRAENAGLSDKEVSDKLNAAEHSRTPVLRGASHDEPTVADLIAAGLFTQGDYDTVAAEQASEVIVTEAEYVFGVAITEHDIAATRKPLTVTQYDKNGQETSDEKKIAYTRTEGVD